MAEFLSEEEQLAQLRGWWQRYGWWLLAAMILGLGGYFLMQYLENSRAETNAAASEVFERYQEKAADPDAAKPLLARLDGEFAGTAYQVMSLLTRGQQATEAGDIDGAIGFYRTAAEGPSVDHVTDIARLRLARALQQKGDSEAAFKALASVDGEGYRSLVAELKGDILKAQGKASEARDAYAAAVEVLGDNPRTLLTMKLADLSAPEGVAGSAGNEATASQSNETAETEDADLEAALESVVNAANDAAAEVAADADAAVESGVEAASDALSEGVETLVDSES